MDGEWWDKHGQTKRNAKIEENKHKIQMQNWKEWQIWGRGEDTYTYVEIKKIGLDSR